MIKSIVNTGLLFSFANIAIFASTSLWFVMPVIAVLNIIIRILQTDMREKGESRFGYSFLANRNTALILNGGALATISVGTLVTGELPAALSVAFMIMGLNQISDACAQHVEDLQTHGTIGQAGASTAYARLNQYSMPLLHGVGYCLIAYATNAALLAVPAYIAAMAGAVFGVRGRKDYAFLGFGTAALIATCLLFAAQDLALTLLFGYPLYAAGNFIRFAEHAKTRHRILRGARKKY